MTSSLSAVLQARILESVLTENLMYFAISWACPLSLCRETEWNDKGPRTGSISASGRLVTQIRRFGSRNPTSSLTSSNTCSRGDGKPVVAGHSSKASMITYTVACPGSISTCLRHCASSLSLACWEPSSCEFGKSVTIGIRLMTKLDQEGRE